MGRRTGAGASVDDRPGGWPLRVSVVGPPAVEVCGVERGWRLRCRVMSMLAPPGGRNAAWMAVWTHCCHAAPVAPGGGAHTVAGADAGFMARTGGTSSNVLAPTASVSRRAGISGRAPGTG